MSIFAPLQHKRASATSATATGVSRLSQRVLAPETSRFPPLEASADAQAGGKPVPRFSLADLPIHAPGQRSASLPDPLRAAMKRLSGLSLDDVRVHYDSLRPLQIDASAYTQGTQIHLGPGQERYLPHEAWHVVQQKQGRVVPDVRLAGGEVVNDEKALEQEADVMGRQARQGATSKPFASIPLYAPHAVSARSAGIQPIQRKMIIADDLLPLLKEKTPDIFNHAVYKQLDQAPQLIYIQQSPRKNDTSVRTDLNKDTFEDRLPGTYQNQNIRYIINLQNTNVQEGTLAIDAQSRLKAFEPRPERAEKHELEEGTSQTLDSESLARLLEDMQMRSLLANPQQRGEPPIPQQLAPLPLMDMLKKIALMGVPKDPYEDFSPRTRDLLTQADELLERLRRQPFPRVHRIDPERERLPTESVASSGIPPISNVNPTGNVLSTGSVPSTGNIPPTISLPPAVKSIPPGLVPLAPKHESLSLHTVLLHEMGHVLQFLRSESPFARGKDVEEISEDSLPHIPGDLLPQAVEALEQMNPVAKIWPQLADLNRVAQIWLTSVGDFFVQKGKDNLQGKVQEAQKTGELVGAQAQVWLEYDVITNVEHPEALKRGEAIRHIHGAEGAVNNPDYKNVEVAKKTIEQTRAKTLQSDPQSLPALQQVMLKNASELTTNLPGLLKAFLGLINGLKEDVSQLKK